MTGCATSTAQEFSRADADTIREMVQSFSVAYNEHNASGVAALFSGSAVLMPPNSSTVRGSDSIQGFYDVRFTQGVSDFSVEVADLGGYGPLAFASGSYSVRLQLPDQPESKDRGKFLWIIRSYSGSWLIDYQIWSSDLPVQMPSEPATTN